MTSRRTFLGYAGIAAAGLSVSACSRPFRTLTRLADPTPVSGTPDSRTAQAARHVLNRLSFGPGVGEVGRVAEIGPDAYIEEQLAPDNVSDIAAQWKVRGIESLGLGAPGVYDFSPEEMIGDLRRGTILRAVYSRRQLNEVMVEFWNDHFNIYSEKGDCARLLVVHDREVIRKHAFGKFRDLVAAVATSPAMLVYLDGMANVTGKPNENFARELLELHTLGIHGGYNQGDVQAAARALNGWRVREGLVGRGRANFETKFHDEGEKNVLGAVVPGGSTSNVDFLVNLVADHPSTAQHLSIKLCRRFIGDAPPASVVEKVGARFRKTDGDIRETLRELFHSHEFTAAGPMFKRPFRFAVSVLRATDADTDGGKKFQKSLKDLGQLPFDRPTPDGFPDGDEHWHAHILPRWNFVASLVNGGIGKTAVDVGALPNTPDELSSHLIGRPLSAHEKTAFETATDPSGRLALGLCLPDFQYH